MRYASVFLLRKGGNTLKQLKLRSITLSIVAVHFNLIAQLKQNICITSICAETDNTRSALSRAADNINKLQLICALIDPVNLDLVNSIIYCAEIFIIRSRTYTVYVRTEVTLCNTSESCMEYAIHQASKSAVLMSMYNSHLTVMISGNIKILTVNICRKETASHSINIYTVDT